MALNLSPGFETKNNISLCEKMYNVVSDQDKGSITQKIAVRTDVKTKTVVHVFENSLIRDIRSLKLDDRPKTIDQENKLCKKTPKNEGRETNPYLKLRDHEGNSSKPGASLPQTKADLSHLLTLRTYSNTVEVQINEVKYVCSGAILGSQSPVFYSEICRGASLIVLEGLQVPKGEEKNVEDCLALLYGGSIPLTDGNIPVIIRFSVLYQVDNLYRLALEWVRHCISVQNVYTLWLLGSEPAVEGKIKRKKNDLLRICRQFVRGKEVEIAFQLKGLKEKGEELREEFVFLMMQYTDCASAITDLLWRS